jgi:hypothetical protein
MIKPARNDRRDELKRWDWYPSRYDTYIFTHELRTCTGYQLKICSITCSTLTISVLARVRHGKETGFGVAEFAG